jgi:hypothetical protein
VKAKEAWSKEPGPWIWRRSVISFSLKANSATYDAGSKTTVSWDFTPCGSSKKNRRFRRKYCLHLQGNETLSLPSSQRGHASRRTAKRASYKQHTYTNQNGVWNYCNCRAELHVAFIFCWVLFPSAGREGRLYEICRVRSLLITKFKNDCLFGGEKTKVLKMGFCRGFKDYFHSAAKFWLRVIMFLAGNGHYGNSFYYVY